MIKDLLQINKSLAEKVDSDKQFNPTSIIAFGYHFESKILRDLKALGICQQEK